MHHRCNRVHWTVAAMLSGTVLGVVLSVLGVVGPIIGIIAWLLVTNSYRLSKRRIVMMVVKHLKIEDVAEDNAGLDPKLALQAGAQPSGELDIQDKKRLHLSAPTREKPTFTLACSLFKLGLRMCVHAKQLL